LKGNCGKNGKFIGALFLVKNLRKCFLLLDFFEIFLHLSEVTKNDLLEILGSNPREKLIFCFNFFFTFLDKGKQSNNLNQKKIPEN
jgi:hypothetical protein